MTLLEKLREHAETSCGDAHATCGEAADEIERLRAIPQILRTEFDKTENDGSVWEQFDRDSYRRALQDFEDRLNQQQTPQEG